MSDEKTKDAEEAQAKNTITVAEKPTGSGGTSPAKDTITVAERPSQPE